MGWACIISYFRPFHWSQPSSSPTSGASGGAQVEEAVAPGLPQGGGQALPPVLPPVQHRLEEGPRLDLLPAAGVEADGRSVPFQKPPEHSARQPGTP